MIFFSLRLVERLNRPDKKKIVVNDVIVNTRGVDEKKYMLITSVTSFSLDGWEGRTGKYLIGGLDIRTCSARRRLTAFPDRLSSTRRALSTSAFALIFATVALQFF